MNLQVGRPTTDDIGAGTPPAEPNPLRFLGDGGALGRAREQRPEQHDTVC